MMSSCKDPSRPVLELRDLNFRFAGADHDTLQKIELTISAGESIGIVGPSGCGKSTLLRIIGKLLSPTSGQRILHVDNIDSPGQIAMVFQDARLLPWLTVRKNLSLPFELTGQVIDDSRIDQLLDMIGLTKADHRKYPRMLSGGMKMRVAVARALVLNPSLLLLDEPFAAVDDLLREQLNEEMIRWQQEFGFSTVLVTHHLGEAVFLSHRVFVLSPPPASISSEFKIPWDTRDDTLRRNSEFTSFVSDIKQQLLKAQKT